jgi:hypothetical protein
MRLAAVLAALIVAICAGLWSAQYSLRVAPLNDGDITLPAPLARFADDPPVLNADDWFARRAPLLRTAFQNFVYGEPPAATPPRVVRRTVIAEHAFDGLGRVEELALQIVSAQGEASFTLVLVTPVNATGPAPVIVVPNFCGNPAAFGGAFPALADPNWVAPRCRTLASRSLTRALHGAHIVRPPFADLLRDGYAIATFSPGEIAPDDEVLAQSALDRLPDASADRLGAVGAWAWSISRVVDQINREPALDHDRIAVFGHSRFGKAALWATAIDPRIGLVIANQSGRLGASPSASSIGETLSQLHQRFPHWFPAGGPQTDEPENVEAALDQNLLLALIAPRPILLGGARLDRWSDPAGAYRAAQAATPVYRLLGHTGLDQPDIETPNVDADIAFYLRPGGHSIRPHDWRMARAFLNAHFRASTP